METKLGSNRKCTVMLYEALGTALFTYCLLVSTADAIAAAFSLFSMLIIFGSVSGGHFNPAVTVGVYISHPGRVRNIAFATFIIVA